MKSNNYDRRKYQIIPYNKGWDKLFEEKAQQVKNIFGAVQVEHIGSTSVDGMYGKPCIDLLVVLENLDDISEDKIIKMSNLGYSYAGAFVMDDARLFREMKDDRVLANIHFFPLNHKHIKEMLTLRDYLRNHKEEVKAYSLLKQDLYERYPNDYASYRREKDEYMDHLLKRVIK